MNPILNYKGTYRILAEIDKSTNDFVRDEKGKYCDNDCYITCQNNSKIYFYGYDCNKHAEYEAYIPSIGRGRNIRKKLNESQISYTNYYESDCEVWFRFKDEDMRQIALIMKVKTFGANISPFSSKNIAKRKDIVIPEDKMSKYKEIINTVPKEKFLLIRKFTLNFLEEVLQPKYLKTDKAFNYKTDIKNLMLSRQTKEYIYLKNCWNDYLEFLKNKLNNN